MDFIEKFSSLYRAYFEYYKTHQKKLNSGIIKQLIFAAFMMIGISVIIGLMTDQISSFIYVYLSTIIITVILSYFYVYFAYLDTKNMSKHIHLFPWLKWVNMFFLYQLLILSIYYIQVVPIVIILIIAIYTGLSIIVFNFVETLLDINFQTIFKSIKTSLLLFIGHSAFLYILPIKHLTLSFLMIFISICLGVLSKTYIEKYFFTRYQLNHRNMFGILLLIAILVGYVVIQIQVMQNSNGEQVVSFFNHQEIFRDEVNIENKHTFDHEEILQLITDDTHIYVRTNQYVHILDHDLSIVESFLCESMTLVDTNHGVMLLEYHQISDYPMYDGFPFSTYQIHTDGQFTPYITFYIDNDNPINYIYYDQPELILFTSLYGDGELRYYDGNEYIDYGTYPPRIIKNDDIYIEFTETYRYGLHRIYGMHTLYRSNIDGDIWKVRFYDNHLSQMISPYFYGYNHLIYDTWNNQYYHLSSDSLIYNNLGDEIYIQPDGSVFSYYLEDIYHYDSDFNLISSYYLNGKLITFENESIFYILGSSIYKVDVSDFGSYQVILNRDVQDWIWIGALLMFFLSWQSYCIKPDAY